MYHIQDLIYDMKYKKQISNEDLYKEMQKIKKVLSILLDKEHIRQSDLDNQYALRKEADKKYDNMIARTQKYIDDNTKRVAN